MWSKIRKLKILNLPLKVHAHAIIFQQFHTDWCYNHYHFSCKMEMKVEEAGKQRLFIIGLSLYQALRSSAGPMHSRRLRRLAIPTTRARMKSINPNYIGLGWPLQNGPKMKYNCVAFILAWQWISFIGQRDKSKKKNCFVGLNEIKTLQCSMAVRHNAMEEFI